MNNLYKERSNPALEDVFAAESRQILLNWRTLESGERASCEWLSSHLGQLHRQLNAIPDFHRKVLRTENLAASSKPYEWIPLLEQDNCRSGLLYLPPGGRIAMHDHQGCIGVSMVLAGYPQISQCGRISAGWRAFSPLILEKISHRTLRPQQQSFLFPRHNNMHGFSSTGSSCLMLNTLFFKSAAHQRRFMSRRLMNHSVSLQSLSSTLQRSLPGTLLSILLSLPTSVYAEDFCRHADPAVTALATMPFEKLERHALDGNVHAQSKLAWRYFKGDGVKKDLYRASIWYRRAAEGGCVEAQYQFGLMLLDGEGVTEDSSDGLEWIFKASQANHIKATRVFNYLMEHPVALDC